MSAKVETDYHAIKRLIQRAHKLGWQDPRGLQLAHDEMGGVRRRLERELAQERGWIVAKAAFSVEQLLEGRPAPRWNSLGWTGRPGAIDGRVLDHVTYFRHAGRPYRPAAMLTHSYAAAGKVAGFAEGLGLAVEFLPWSWYYPDACTAALLTPVGEGKRGASVEEHENEIFS